LIIYLFILYILILFALFHILTYCIFLRLFYLIAQHVEIRNSRCSMPMTRASGDTNL